MIFNVNFKTFSSLINSSFFGVWTLYVLISVYSSIYYLYCCLFVCFCFLWRCGPTRAMASSFLRFLDHTQRRTTVGRTPLDEWSARRRDLFLTTHNTHNRQTSMPPVWFEPTISASERPQTYALDRAATGIGIYIAVVVLKWLTLISLQFTVKSYCLSTYH